jgi:hypothetical protein
MESRDHLDRVRRGEEPAHAHQDVTRIRLKVKPHPATSRSAKATRPGSHIGVLGGSVLVLGRVAAAQGTLIVTCVLAGGLDAVTVAVPHPLPAVKTARTPPVLQLVVALAGATVEPVTPLVLNVTVALHTGLPLASLSWNWTLQLAPGLVLEHDCVTLNTLPGGVYALTAAAPPRIATAARAKEAPNSRSRRGAVDMVVKMLPPRAGQSRRQGNTPTPPWVNRNETTRSRSR